MLNATFHNISVISWRLVLLVEETGVPGENLMMVIPVEETGVPGENLMMVIVPGENLMMVIPEMHCLY